MGKQGTQCKHKKAFAIYKLTSPAGKSYVGQAQCLVCRFARYKWGQSHRGTSAIASAVAKYGWANMQREILMQGVPEQELDAAEIKLIAEHGTLAPAGYNIHEGGRRHSGYQRATGPPVKGPRSEQTKARISESRAEKREAIIATVTDAAEADRVREALALERAQKANRRNGNSGDKEESKAKRAATWEAKLQAKLAQMPPECAERHLKQVMQRRAAKATYRAKHPEKVKAEVQAAMGRHRTRYNDSRPRLTGNLRANCAQAEDRSWMLPSDDECE